MKEFFYLRSLKDHRPKCDGVKVLTAHWQRSPVNGEYMCGVPGCTANETWQGMYGVRQHFFAEHVTEEDNVFKCDYCEARFAYKNVLKRHIAFVHEEKKPFECHICYYIFSQKVGLKKHVASVHEGKKA